jgi:luciferase family oxidoreductase group 1
LRRDPRAADQFASDVVELQAWLREAEPDQAVRAVPGAGSNVPIWILGSSLFGAQLAATLGLPFAFASHFAPAQLTQALDLYRARFKASDAWQTPHVMLGVNVIAADDEVEAQRLSTSLQQAFVNLRRGRPGPLPRPDETFPERMTSAEQTMLNDALACSWIGTRAMVHNGLRAFAQRTGADELMVTSQIYDHRARLHSFEIAAGAFAHG